jgi:hypothetical protein
VGHSLPQVLQRGSKETRNLGQGAGLTLSFGNLLFRINPFHTEFGRFYGIPPSASARSPGHTCTIRRNHSRRASLPGRPPRLRTTAGHLYQRRTAFRVPAGRPRVCSQIDVLNPEGASIRRGGNVESSFLGPPAFSVCCTSRRRSIEAANCNSNLAGTKAA